MCGSNIGLGNPYTLDLIIHLQLLQISMKIYVFEQVYNLLSF